MADVRHGAVTGAGAECCDAWASALNMHRWLHYIWAGAVVVALLLNVVWPPYPGYAVWALSLMAYPVATAVILSNVRGNRVGRILGIVSGAAGTTFAGGWFVWVSRDSPWSTYLEAAIAAAAPALFWGAISLLYLFPTGSIPRRFARASFRTFSVVIGLMMVLSVVEPGPMVLTGRHNPIGGPWWVTNVFESGIAILVPAVFIGIWAAVDRWRTSPPVERSQLKWFVAGTLPVTGLVVVVMSPEELPQPFEFLAGVVVVLGFWALPAAIVIAITRHRLYEIDRLVARTVTYAIVAGTLVAMYGLAVVGLQAVLPARSSDLVVAGSTLAVAAVFNPLRVRVQRLVDRRFYRARYDAEHVVMHMTEGLQNSVSVEAVLCDTQAVITDVFAPAVLAVWLPETSGALAGVFARETGAQRPLD